LVAELCLEYKIYDLQLWNGLLQKLLGFNMVSKTEDLLKIVHSIPHTFKLALATERAHAGDSHCP
jgi:hypothetical protein